ncbi:MAG: DUF1844 domain-containing protein [Pirellulales bacterium]|nr:DUF1844 domain-containing protein [Pirellulales bacterium]
MSEEKKIIIDEDWKTQVAAEKAAAERQAKEKPGESASAGGPTSDPSHEPIQASFELLITTFVTEAMSALGQLPHPATGQLEFDPEHARFAIDMLDVIAAKTKGNLTPDEERGLQEVIHQLRMGFIAISNQHSAASQKTEPPLPPSG